MTSKSSNPPSSGDVSAAKTFIIAALVDLLFYAIYRLWVNSSGLLESDDLFYFELAEASIRGGYSPVLHLADLNRAIVFIIQIIFELFEWNDPSLFVCPGIVLYWFSTYNLFGRRFSYGFVIPGLLIIYPDLLYVRYHMFKDIIIVSLVALFVHFYDQRRFLLAITVALLCAPFRFYLFPLIAICVALLNVRRFSLWSMVVFGFAVLGFYLKIDVVSIVLSTLSKETFGSGGDYTVKRVAESLGISNPFLLMPLVALSFFFQPSPGSVIQSNFDQIVPYSFLSTYFLLIPIIIYLIGKRKILSIVDFGSVRFVLIFSVLYVATFAFDPVLADMRHRVILVLPVIMVYFRVVSMRGRAR
ncbi:hypothetical protein ACFOKJ_09170 [Vogesella amnigena]|uniref:Glycosyltransferase RgtA/B/C/D-like domain-containing protein n=1 Tax=Vogesella amnigena TaxID=1507449 RepID=A0ABV7TU67_9NEIS